MKGIFKMHRSNQVINKVRLTSLALAAFALPSLAFAADYVVDKGHSHVGFTVKHLVSKVKGQFNDFEGKFSFDPAALDTATGKFVVKAKSIYTGDDKRDAHLRNEDFFDVKKYPEIVLDKIKVSPNGDKFKLVGDLTMHGVTKSVSFDLEFGGLAADPWGNQRAGFTATTIINRKDYGLIWNKVLDAGGVMIGEDVALELQVEAIQAKAGDAKAPEGDAKKAANKDHKKKH